MQDTKGKVILSLLAGATAGAIAGLLLAPETGDETRSGLKKSAAKFSDDLNKLFKDGVARLNSLKEQEPASAQQQSDRSAADSLLNSLGTETNNFDEVDSDLPANNGVSDDKKEV